MDLIKINQTQINGAEVNSVNSREVYEYLEIETNYTTWLNRAIEKYDFKEDEDFISILEESNGGRPAKVFIVTIDMAKELCMVSNTDKGKQARRYFIEVEKRANKPLSFEEMVKQTLTLANNKIEALERKIEDDKPLVSFAKSVEASINSVLIRDWVKALSQESGTKIGQNRAYGWLKSQGYLMQSNEPYQRYIDNDYFEYVPRTVATTNGTREVFTTKITGIGQIKLAEKIVSAFSRKVA